MGVSSTSTYYNWLTDNYIPSDHAISYNEKSKKLMDGGFSTWESGEIDPSNKRRGKKS